MSYPDISFSLDSGCHDCRTYADILQVHADLMGLAVDYAGKGWYMDSEKMFQRAHKIGHLGLAYRYSFSKGVLESIWEVVEEVKMVVGITKYSRLQPKTLNRYA